MPDARGPSSQVLEDLRARQVEAWRRGEPLLVEVLVSDVKPPLAGHELLELIASEATLRGELGQTCTSVEYIQRFPQLAEAIEQILGTQRTLKFTSTKTDSPIALVIDESQKTVRKPETGAASDPHSHTVLGIVQQPAKVPKPPDVRIPAGVASTAT
ncbi:MAG: hypothetical protein JNL58_18050 [Planctomyces sp.]|nr:hypothetical protein [Planctomyces sp.]